MAYAVDRTHTCQVCHRTGNWEVLNNRNEQIGWFCKRHADVRVASISAEEDRG